MFGASARENYDALYDTLQQPGDTSALEREKAPGFLQGDLGESALGGIKSAGSRAELSAVDISRAQGGVPPQLGMYGIDREIEAGVYGEAAQQWLKETPELLQKRRQQILERMQSLRPDPKTNGTASQLLFGVGDVLGTVALTAANPYAGGGLYGYSQAQVGMADGLDPLTAYGKGAIEGAAMGVSVALPAAISGGLAFRSATGAALNVGVGIPERAAVSTLLNSRGYSEMAQQYAPLDATSIMTEIVLGAAFGGVLGPRAKAAKLPAPEAIPPSVVDAALVANEQIHAEIHTAPGVPVDTRSRQAHATALDSAVESLVMGRDVNVENLLKDAGFLGQRPDFDAMRIIADELDKAGANDLVARVRELEAEAKSKGLYVEADSLGSVVLSDKAVQPKVSGLDGRASEVRIGDDKVPARYMLVEAADIRATMAKAENQFRDRTRVASEQQIESMAAKLDAALLRDSPVMDYGAPVLAADGRVVGGNGRAAAVNLAYERGTAEAYREALRADFGDAVDGMKAPMAVRVLTRDVDVAKAAILSNEGQALRMSALEQAKVDAERLGDFRAFEFGEDGRIDLAANMGFVRQWAEQMPVGQRAALMDADGRLSSEGQQRLRNAVLYRAYGDSPTLARLVEATDPGSRNIAAALVRVSAKVADTEAAMLRGDLFDVSLRADIVAAVEKLHQVRQSGLTLKDWSAQLDAFGDGLTAEGRMLMLAIGERVKSSREIADVIGGYYDRAAAFGDPKQSALFSLEAPTKESVLRDVLGVRDDLTDAKLQSPEVENPSMQIPDGQGNMVSAADEMARATENVSKAQEVAPGFVAAAECAMRFGT